TASSNPKKPSLRCRSPSQNQIASCSHSNSPNKTAEPLFDAVEAQGAAQEDLRSEILARYIQDSPMLAPKIMKFSTTKFIPSTTASPSPALESQKHAARRKPAAEVSTVKNANATRAQVPVAEVQQALIASAEEVWLDYKSGHLGLPEIETKKV